MKNKLLILFIGLLFVGLKQVNASTSYCYYMDENYFIDVEVINKIEVIVTDHGAIGTFTPNMIFSKANINSFLESGKVKCPNYALGDEEYGEFGQRYNFSFGNYSTNNYEIVVPLDDYEIAEDPPTSSSPTPASSTPASSTPASSTPTTPKEPEVVKPCKYGDTLTILIYDDGSLVGNKPGYEVNIYDTVNAFTADGECPTDVSVETGTRNGKYYIDVYTEAQAGRSEVKFNAGANEAPVEMKVFRFGNDPEIREICSSSGFLKILKMVLDIITILKVAVPLILIVGMLTVEIYPLISNPSEVKKILEKSKKKIIAAVLIFFVPTIMNVILSALGDSTSVSTCYEHAKDAAYIKERENAEKNYFSGTTE